MKIPPLNAKTRMIRKLLIANRGEIACRVIRTCRELGIATVAVYSDADASALHVEMADEAVRIGEAQAAASYLNAAAILAAAQRTHADAVHPGYGFLAENAAFARAVIDGGLIWIGPPPEAIALMGDKRRAKLLLKDVPLVPGYSGDDQSDEALVGAAARIGFPIMVKAAAGGGGKGMRLVDDPAALPEALAAARREAQTAFGDQTLILEKYIAHGRHVEIQIFGDHHGRVIALGERDCSLQRRHQKVIEESPSPALDADLRARMCAAAISVGRQIGYTNAGTVEFLLDETGQFYFLEMNTRLQVEHPVTEAVYGLDLVAWQIRVAEGDPLPAAEALPAPSGHAIEARLYAEDPAGGFLPSIGRLLHWRAPQEVRVESGVRAGDVVTVHYDPMLAKVIAWAEDRPRAARKLAYALGKLEVLGVRTNRAFLRRLLEHPDFLAGRVDTSFIDRHPELAESFAPPLDHALAAAAAALEYRPSHPETAYWRNNPYRPARHQFKIGEQTFTAHIRPVNAGGASGKEFAVEIADSTAQITVKLLEANSSSSVWALDTEGHIRRAVAVSAEAPLLHVQIGDDTIELAWIDPLPTSRERADSAGSLRSPMPGQIIRVHVSEGQAVQKGDVLLVVEAMKMEHRIKAPYAGRVTAVHYSVGQSVQAGVNLLDLQASE